MPDILPVLIGAGVGGAAAGTGVRLIARVHEAVTRCALDEPLQEGPAPAHRWPYPWTTRGERGLDRLPFVPAHIGLMMGGHSDPVCLRAEHFAVPRPSLRGRGSLRSPKHVVARVGGIRQQGVDLGPRRRQPADLGATTPWEEHMVATHMPNDIADRPSFATEIKDQAHCLLDPGIGVLNPLALDGGSHIAERGVRDRVALAGF